jgi:23S rRNA (adenine1618-N6)-methyltransferase
LLKADFGLTILLPDDRLCPPVPVRWNYVHWIQELLDTTSEDYGEHFDPEREVIGLDIGVGASSIYPLLACATRSGWRMAGTDIDKHSFGYARQNVEANGFGNRIRLALSPHDGPLIPLDKMGMEEIDFVMTNPPFYTSHEDMKASYTGKSAPPSAVCTGSENEMICPGGDVGFVTRIFEESLKLRERVEWYTAMLGKMSSLQQIVMKLKEANIGNFAVTALTAGHRTKRWAVAWSFADYRPRNDVARHGSLVHAVLPQPTAQTIAVASVSAADAGKRVDALLSALDVRWRWRTEVGMGVMLTKENVWSRSARRKRQRLEGGDGTANTELASAAKDDDEVGLAVKVTCKDGAVDLRWLQGQDHVLFQSFCGLLKRSLTQAPAAT